MYLSNFFEQKVLGCFAGVSFTGIATPYITLSSTDPGESGAGIFEPSYTGFARMPLTLTAPAPMSGVANSVGFSNQAEIKFAKADTDQASATHIAIFDSLAGGNMLAYARLDTAKAIRANVEPVIRVGEARFWFASANTTAELKTRILNVLRGVTMNAITPYASLANGAEELSGGNFARVPVAFTAPVLLATGAHEIANDSLVEFAIASAALGNYDTDCLYDAATGGSLLIAYPGATDYYAAGDRTAYDPGEWKFSLN